MNTNRSKTEREIEIKTIGIPSISSLSKNELDSFIAFLENKIRLAYANEEISKSGEPP